MVIGYKHNGKIELKVKFNGVGTYTLTESGTVRYYDLVGQDVITNSYSLDPNDKTSELTITKWNPTSKELEATFQVTLKKTASGGASGGPETLRFTGGELKGKVTQTRKEVSWVNVEAPVIKMGKLVPGVDSLRIHLTNETGQLLLLIPFTGVSKYPYHQKLTGFFYEYEGAVWTSMYEFNPEGESEVEITSWNPDTKQIKGSFRVALKKAYVYLPDKNAVHPVTSGELLNFSGGLFEGEVKPF